MHRKEPQIHIAIEQKRKVYCKYRKLLSAFLCLYGLTFFALAQQPSSSINYSSDVFPILHTNCVGCHSASLKMGGLVMESYDGLLKGGASGPAIVPGASSKSRMVLMLEGKIQPRMPPKGQLKPSEIGAIKAWIDAGARMSEPRSEAGAASKPKAPEINPATSVLPQVCALAFRRDGRALAIAGYKEVQIYDLGQSAVTGSLSGPCDVVRSLAYSPDGRWLAAGGGQPARFGEVIVWNAATGKLAQTLKGHSDYIYAIAFSPDSKLVATSSYDKLIKLWEVDTGRELRTFKDHTDAVYPVAFSPDGKLLASGAADRTVKIWDVASGRRLFTLSDALDAVYTLAFHPSGKQLSAAGAERLIHTWDLTPEGGTLARSTIAHEDSIMQIAYSPDGRTLASTSADRLIKIWDVEKGTEIKVLDAQKDWALALVFSPDGSLLAVGRYDGSVSLYDTANGMRTLDPIRAPRNAPKFQ